MDFKQYDDRIARIMSKMEALKEREFYITCGDWPCVWEAPVPENKVASFEKKKGIRLPEDYRRLLPLWQALEASHFMVWRCIMIMSMMWNNHFHIP